MEEFLSQQEDYCKKLARSNINILNITPEFVFYEYQFRMSNGQTKWTKTVYRRRTQDQGIGTAMYDILDIVRGIRMEVE